MLDNNYLNIIFYLHKNRKRVAYGKYKHTHTQNNADNLLIFAYLCWSAVA